MKKILFLLTLLFVVFPTKVDAHTLKTDGSIGAVMHVDPEDDPIVGKQSNFFFEFKDTNKAFESKNCECAFSVLQNGKVLYSQPLFQNTNSALASYYFPEKGIYTIRLTGQSRTDQSFSPFTLDFNLRVSRTTDTQNNQGESNWFIDHIPHLIGGVIGFSILSFLMLKNRKKD